MSKLMKIDPSRTTMLRRQFERDIAARFFRLRAAVNELVKDLDVFGLVEAKPVTFNAVEPSNNTAPVPHARPQTPGRTTSSTITANIDRQAWRFRTDDEKLTAFNRWFAGQVKDGVLSVDAANKPWTSKYVESAYRKGVLRGYFDAKPKVMGRTPDFYEGSQEQFLSTAFGRPERVSKVRLLGTRTYEELKGISGAMSQQMSRILAGGIANGRGAADIARDLSKSITSITRTRARVLARTEIIHAHAEGQLDSFEDLGIDEVGVQAEWSTAEDEKVCSRCEELEGVVMSVEDARELIPRHPGCRCAWVPADVEQHEPGQLWGRKSEAAVRKSIRAEKPKAPAKVAREQSTWAGKEILNQEPESE